MTIIKPYKMMTKAEVAQCKRTIKQFKSDGLEVLDANKDAKKFVAKDETMTRKELVQSGEKRKWKTSIIEDIKYKDGHYWVTKSIKDFSIKVVLVAIKQKQAITGADVYNISESIKDFGLDNTLFAVEHKEAKDSWDVYGIAKAKFNENKVIE